MPLNILSYFILETAACSSQKTSDFVLEPSDFILLIIGLAAYIGAVRLAILSSKKSQPKLFYVPSSKELAKKLLKLEEVKETKSNHEKYLIFKYRKYVTLSGLIIADICFLLAGLCIFITNGKEVSQQARLFFFAGLIALVLLHIFSWIYFINKVSNKIAKWCVKNLNCPNSFWKWLILLTILFLMIGCPILVAELSKIN